MGESETEVRDRTGGIAVSRTLWRMLEVVHSVVYYAPERTDIYRALGFKGGWMAYFATRSGALGQVPPSVVTACFYGFAPRMVERALPDAWTFATPKQAIAGRYEVFHQALTRVLGTNVDRWAMDDLAHGLADAVGQVDPAGSPLFAAHASLEMPSETHLKLFWATAALREYRGDAHVAALRSAGVGPIESHVLMVALGLVPIEQRNYRGWTEDEWTGGVASLTERGWLDPRGEVTREGQRCRSAIERDTDKISARAWSTRDDRWITDVINQLAPIAGQMVTGGAVPFPNGMGVAAVPELAVPR